jgi:flavorubredoxin/flavin reductase (DIM6/NTAB) family NADH-FMN oxidoreductase RutF
MVSASPTTQPRDIQANWIATDSLALRSRSWNRLRFEVEYGLERGTTSNSYIIQGDQTLIVNPPGESFTDIFLTALADRYDLTTIDYLVLGHINANRIATAKALLLKAPQITIVLSNPGHQIFTRIYDDQIRAEMPADFEPKFLIIKSTETIDLGKGHHIEFVLAPTPRYPGGLLTFDPATRILYSDKFFSAHRCGDQVFDEGWPQFTEDQRYFFDTVMAPHARQVATVLDKLTELPIYAYAPVHGPIVRYGLTELTQSYQTWCANQLQQTTMVALLYASAYGSTATLANAIAQGLSKSGVRVESINCEMTSPDEIRTIVEQCDGFIIGSPTLGGHAPTPIQTALGIVLSTVPRDRLAGVFGSFGWSGEAIDLLESKLKDGGYRFGFETMRVKFQPTAAILKTSEEAGTDFAQKLKKEKKRAERQAAGGSSSLASSQFDAIEQAVGRILGALCVLTTQKGDLRSAMLASWISQATFSPPGLTVAIAKDRAVEALTYSGDTFVLNLLAEGRDVPMMKQFLKPFAPGADRFEGVNYDDSAQGNPILKDALAYLECRVVSRMECGDHWVIYASIDNGKLLDANSRTAIHHRKTGSRY